MLIYENNLTGSAAEAGRTQETQKSERSESTRSGAAGYSGPIDRVEFSSALGSLSRAMSADGSSRANYVQALAARYDSGNYHPDSAAVGRAMVSDALCAGSN